MLRNLRVVVPVLVVVGCLGWLASWVVETTAWRWMVNDAVSRSQVALGGARDGLLASWRRGDRDALGRQLAALTHESPIAWALLCTADLERVAQTRDYPTEFGCASVGARSRLAVPGAPRGRWSWRPWSGLEQLEGERVQVTAEPVKEDGRTFGVAVLVQRMGYAERRVARLEDFIAIFFGLIGLFGAIGALQGYRFFWRDWTDELRRMLGGKASRPEFHPLLQDVQELVSQLADESQDGGGPVCTPERLRQTLRRHLRGEKILVVANREPYIHDRAPNGEIVVRHPASGLVTALEPVMRACSGVWIAHGSGTADRETADRRGRLSAPPGESAYTLRRIWLSKEEEQGFYFGFANEGLWPLCHLAHARPIFRKADWEHYRKVNQRFADAVCEEAEGPDPIVLVQDYHFALAPRMIRERLPGATILSFWHIPWPHAEQIAICPWYAELLEGLLGSSILGFHIQLHCNNFLEAADRYLEARVDRERMGVVLGGRATLVRPYPISIEWPPRWLADSPPVNECRRSVFQELGLREGMLLGVGVDRLDYTKGIEERFLAVERLLEREARFRGRFVFAQLGAPSRSTIPRYQQMNDEIDQVASRINRRFGGPGYKPIQLLRQHHEPPTVFRYYRAADLCSVSSLHDGMNLVAKEFVAARDDCRGVLVLSPFTGAARELTEALLANPYDVDRSSAALAAALDMPVAEQEARMKAMRRFLGEFNVYRWAERMLVDAARNRLAGRLSERLREAARAS